MLLLSFQLYRKISDLVMLNPLVYIKQVGQELHQVTWPTRQQTQKKTLVVLAVSILLALYIGIIDVALQWLIGILLTS